VTAIFGRLRRSRHFWPVIGLAALTLLMFGDVLLSPKPVLLSVEGGDIFLEDVYWREFAFGQLRKGNFPFWNPHIFSGTPFFGGFQSGLLYPLNLHYLVLPVHRAINISIALHVFLLGLFMYLWASWRGLRRLSAVTTGILVMFSGAYFMNIFAGHLGPIGAMVWAPLIFLAIDMILDRPTLGRALLGMFAVAMQIVADAPQYVFFTAVAAAIYTLLRWLPEPNKWRRALALIGMCAGALALTAVEVVPSLLAAAESSRGSGVPLSFASEFAFPPENLITMIAPHFFGNMVDTIYWGRCLLWEMLPSIGVIGLVLAVYGLCFGRRRARRWSLAMVLALLVLSLGRHLSLMHAGWFLAAYAALEGWQAGHRRGWKRAWPWATLLLPAALLILFGFDTSFFELIYRYVPGFSNVRGMSKFTYHMVLFLALLSGVGLDHLLRTRRVPWGLIAGIAAALLVIAGFAFHLALAPESAIPAWWLDFMRHITSDKESLVAPSSLEIGAFVQQAVQVAGASLLFAAGVLFVLGLFLAVARFAPRALLLVPLLAVIEVSAFARLYMRPTFPYELTRPPIAAVAEGLTRDDRLLYPERPDTAMGMGHYDIWGYGPFVSRRYAEFMAITQGEDPDEIVQNVEFGRLHPLYLMLRARYAIKEEGGRLLQKAHSPGFPYVLLLKNFTVVTARDDIFAALTAPGFDFGQEAVLENDPGFAPEPGPAQGDAKVVERGSDYLVIEAETSRPAILVVTDAYASGWTAKGLEGSAQQVYKLLPANYVLRAVPVSPGKHRILMEYMPRGLSAGRAITLLALLAALPACVVSFRGRHRIKRRTQS
jgi:hypothetical protein